MIIKSGVCILYSLRMYLDKNAARIKAPSRKDFKVRKNILRAVTQPDNIQSSTIVRKDKVRLSVKLGSQAPVFG